MLESKTIAFSFSATESLTIPKILKTADNSLILFEIAILYNLVLVRYGDRKRGLCQKSIYLVVKIVLDCSELDVFLYGECACYQTAIQLGPDQA